MTEVLLNDAIIDNEHLQITQRIQRKRKIKSLSNFGRHPPKNELNEFMKRKANLRFQIYQQNSSAEIDRCFFYSFTKSLIENFQ